MTWGRAGMGCAAVCCRRAPRAVRPDGTLRTARRGRRQRRARRDDDGRDGDRGWHAVCEPLTGATT
jgi:hypothetical protein